MIYKYKKYIEHSHNGISLDIIGEGVKYLGKIGEWDYA